MEMHEVRYFLAACETMNFHRAASTQRDAICLDARNKKTRAARRFDRRPTCSSRRAAGGAANIGGAVLTKSAVGEIGQLWLSVASFLQTGGLRRISPDRGSR
jgi:hypothetical protein